MPGGPVTAPTRHKDGADSAVRIRRRFLPLAGVVALALVLPLGLLAVWSAAASLGQLPEQILPPPWVVFETLSEAIQDGSLLSSTVTSLRRVGEGFAAGALLGLVFGTAIGLSKTT